MEDIDETVLRTDVECNKKRKKLFGDERLHRNRERNRMHARKTRERKKQQSNALQTRLNELENEGKKLRQIVDDRYTARVLLGLSQTYKNNLGENFDVQTSATICQNGFAPRADNGVPTQNGCDATFVPLQGGSIDDENDADNADGTTMGADQNTTTKRVRRRGKYTPQEREKIRRERNRMHAKRTRDRKKKLLESSETQISRMERESHLLRGYCVSLNMLSAEEASKCEERTCESKRELAALKASQGEYDVDCDEDDDNDLNQNDEDGDGDDEHDNDGSLSGSDDNEKSSSWNGSNSENESLDSISGETSGDVSTSSSGKDKNSGHANNNSSSESNSLHSHSSSGSGSGSGGDSPTPKRPCTDRKAAKNFSYGTKPSKNFNPKSSQLNQTYPAHSHVYAPPHPIPESSPRCVLTASSQSAESYNHGGVMPGNNAEGSYGPFPLPTEAPAASTAVLSVSQIKATLAAVDHFKGEATGTVVTTKSSPRAIQPSESYSLSILQHAAVPQVKKVKNILLSVIQAGISAPLASGGISPQGAFTPVTTNWNSQVAPRRHMEASSLCTYAPVRELRNLPSSNSNNACKPL